MSPTSDNFSEDKTSGSEYLPSEDDSDTCDQSNKTDFRYITENIRPVSTKTVRKRITVNKKRIIRQNIFTPQSNIMPDSTTSPCANFIASSPPFSLCSSSEVSTQQTSSNIPSSTCHDINRPSLSFHDMNRPSSSFHDLDEGSAIGERERTIKVIGATKEKGKLVRNKGQACYFCQRIVQNAARHFELLHKRVGNFYHNTEVLATKKGNLILVRRPTEDESRFSTATDYGPCPFCLGFMLKKHLWHHVKNSCTAKPQKDDQNTGRHVIAESHALLNDAFGRDFSTDFVANILSKLRDDDIGIYCKEDQLIQRYGAMMFEKYGTTQCELIRQGMRQLARLTLKLREIDKSKRQLTDFLVPEMFDLIIQGTKSLCVTHQNIALRPEFELPSLALKIGRSGEAARMTLVAYSSRPKWSDQSTEELKHSLTDFEKKLADQLTLVEIVGKRGRKVPVLLTQDVKSSVDKLIQTRESPGAIKKPKIAPALRKSSVVQVAPREAVAKSKTSDRRPWSSEEKEAVFQFFKSSIKRGVVPGKEDCTKCIQETAFELAQMCASNKIIIKENLIRKNTNQKMEDEIEKAIKSIMSPDPNFDQDLEKNLCPSEEKAQVEIIDISSPESPGCNTRNASNSNKDIEDMNAAQCCGFEF
ncbi:unnamed protein product [Ceutorhynchus assimilis]|uniref:Uncharacterized protein n=1 Tax=Ceutorhynchus assimilis TaxID=467358 RepID=A0A9N9QNR7_9CUCU|nr:unnamed protein product [Ceutorhynchus assimilis]